MKIGILTYHRAENYGALLQAYALRTYLQSLGHDVSFVDYWPEYHKDYFRILPRKRMIYGRLKSKAASLYYGLVWCLPRMKRKRVLESFMRNFLSLSDCPQYTTGKDYCSEFEVVIYGSDQIWRRQELPGHKGVDYWYYGSDNIKARKIAYAASMGANKPSKEELSELLPLLTNFELLTVRETSLKNYLKSFNIDAKLVVDPVFLLRSDQWRELSERSSAAFTPQKYILFYNLLNNPASSKFAETLGEKTGLPIIEITKRYGFHYLGSRYLHSVSVPQFVRLIDKASYVVSNSFHGVAMSIILGKQFYAVGMGKKADRVKSLLEVFGIQDRCFEASDQADIPPIDYEAVGIQMESYIASSKQILQNSI